MLIHNNIALHNTVELEEAPGGGVFLRRWPRSVRQILTPLGRMVAQESAGVELRFVTEAAHFRLSLGSQPSVLAPYEHHAGDVVIFRGAFFHSHHRITPGNINHLNIGAIGEGNRLLDIKPEAARGCGFSPDVWRVFLGRYPAIFYGLDTYDFAVRPPRSDEMPRRSWTAYGSSITNGAGATVHHNSYVYHAARGAGLDVCNVGLSGSCLCQPEVADYLAGRECDLLTLEIGVNMRPGFAPGEFRERATYLLEKVCSQQPERKVLLLSIYPNSASADFGRDTSHETALRQQAFDTILRELAAQRRFANLSLVDGSEILDDFSGLTCDVIHPSDYGHARMGHNLARHLKTLS